MKRNFVAIMLGLALTSSSMMVYAEEASTEASSEEVVLIDNDTSSDQTEQEQSQTIIGQVSEVTEDSITLSLGTLTESGPKNDGTMEDNPQSDGTQETSANPDGENSQNTDKEDSLNTSVENSQDAEEENSQDTGEENSQTEESGSSQAPENAPDFPVLSLELSGEEVSYTYSDSVSVSEDPRGAFIAVISEDTSSDAAPDAAPAPSDAENTLAEEAASNTANGSDAQEPNSNGEVPDEETEVLDISVEDIQVGDVVTLELNDSGEVTAITRISSDSHAPENPASLGESSSPAEDNGQEDDSEAETDGAA